MNTNIILFENIDRIQIRIFWYSNIIRIIFEYRIIRSPLTQDIESLNFIEFSKRIKRIRSNFNLVLFGRGQVKHTTILTNECYKI